MPDVNLREGYLTSRKVASLWENPAAERFYFHLLLVVDENTGETESDYVLLKNKCFPAVENVSCADVCRWTVECVKADLLEIVTKNGKEFIRVNKHELPKKKTAKRNCGGFKKWTLEEFNVSVSEAVAENPAYGEFAREFTEYWTEPDANGRMRFSLQQTWRTSGRLATWRKHNERNTPSRWGGGGGNGTGGSYGRYTPRNG